MLALENHWLRLEVQIDFLRTIWNELGDGLQLHQNRLLQVLQTKLQEATILIDGAIGDPEDEVSIGSVVRKKGRLRKGVFALSLRESLEQTIKDLERWHGMFDPSWFLITRISSRQIDKHLTPERATKSDLLSTIRKLREELRPDRRSPQDDSSVFMSTAQFLPQRRPIPFSPSRLLQDRENGKDVIADTVSCNSLADRSASLKDIQDLARVLSKSDPLTFGLFACRGVIKLVDTADNVTGFDLMFTIPAALKSPQSFRSLLLKGDQLYPLDERIDLAKQLAKSVLFVHTSQFVHKNIRPETILVFKHDTSALGKPFLVGFERHGGS